MKNPPVQEQQYSPVSPTSVIHSTTNTYRTSTSASIQLKSQLIRTSFKIVCTYTLHSTQHALLQDKQREQTITLAKLRHYYCYSKANASSRLGTSMFCLACKKSLHSASPQGQGSPRCSSISSYSSCILTQDVTSAQWSHVTQADHSSPSFLAGNPATPSATLL